MFFLELAVDHRDNVQLRDRPRGCGLDREDDVPREAETDETVSEE